ncbi:MAG: aldo/keto reductase [Longimicrobiales bacterium]|nr:aldo/keto reductase [Longimicrobiales bacterium]
MMSPRDEISRREALRLGAGALGALAAGIGRALHPSGVSAAMSGAGAAARAEAAHPAAVAASSAQSDLILRTIPASGETIPAVGLGTWQTFDVGSDQDARAPLGEVLRLFHEMGGTVVDSSPMYGSSQEVLGDLAAANGLVDDLWVATKVWIRGQEAGREQMRDSMTLLHRPEHLELMQIHNLRDWELHLETLEEWKAEGRFDYIGITTSSERQYDDVAAILEAESDRIDFLQINYSLGERRSAERILPMARERGVAVMINRPFAGGRLFGAVEGRELPDWASEFDAAAWSQLFLKYVLSHPAVTVAIPATSDPTHLVENMGALRGDLPDAELRQRMEEVVG